MRHLSVVKLTGSLEVSFLEYQWLDFVCVDSRSIGVVGVAAPISKYPYCQRANGTNKLGNVRGIIRDGFECSSSGSAAAPALTQSGSFEASLDADSAGCISTTPC